MDWQKNMKTRDGSVGDYMGRCDVSGLHKVLIQHGRAFNRSWPTVYLYDDNGSCRRGAAVSPLDIVGPT